MSTHSIERDIERLKSDLKAGRISRRKYDDWMTGMNLSLERERAAEQLDENLDPTADAHVTMLLARIMSIETLLDMIWTNELARQDHPEEEAINLKESVLDLLVWRDDPLRRAVYECVEERLDSIIKRVRSL